MDNHPIKYARAVGATRDQMISNVRASPLYQHGDCILVWVNEGTFWMTQPCPVDVDAEAVERKEYERLKAKFG